MLFLVGNFFASAMGGGGAVAATTLTANVSNVAPTMPVADTDDFLNAPVGYPAYIQIDDEIMYYVDNPVAHDATNFYQVVRGQPDPVNGVSTQATTHLSGARVRTLEIAAIDSFMGFAVTTSTAGFGPVQGMQFLGRLFYNIPKFVMWNYPFLNTGAIVYFKFFVLYPLSIGFVITAVMQFLIMIFGLIKTIV